MRVSHRCPPSQYHGWRSDRAVGGNVDQLCLNDFANIVFESDVVVGRFGDSADDVIDGFALQVFDPALDRNVDGG